MTVAPNSDLLIYYDLELCDGSFTSEIYQVGGKTSNSEFSTFILPNGSIDWGVTKFAGGIRIKTDDHGNRQLVKSTSTIKSVTANEGLHAFILWIKKLKEDGENDRVILIAHGTSDMPALLNNIEMANLTDELKAVVDVFVDSLKYFQSCFPDWKKYNISSMYLKTFHHEKTDVHDALEDAKALYEIMEEMNKNNRDELIQAILKDSVGIDDGYTISAKRVAKSIRKRKVKEHMSTNVKRFCAFPAELLEQLEKEQGESPKVKNPVSELTELCTKRGWSAPEFCKGIESETNKFIFKVVVNEKTYQFNTPCKKKKAAEANAANEALKQILLLTETDPNNKMLSNS